MRIWKGKITYIDRAFITSFILVNLTHVVYKEYYVLHNNDHGNLMNFKLNII